MDPFHRFHQALQQLAPLSPEDWALIAPSITDRVLRKHDTFCREGQRANEVGFVTGGLLRQFYTVDGLDKTTWFFFESSLLCSYISCLTSRPSLVTIEALTDVTYFSLPYMALASLYAKSAAWLNVGKAVAEWAAIGLESRMLSLLTQKPEERYRQLMLSNDQKILEQVPQQYVASYLGITPVSLSRIRSRFSRR